MKPHKTLPAWKQSSPQAMVSRLQNSHQKVMALGLWGFQRYNHGKNLEPGSIVGRWKTCNGILQGSYVGFGWMCTTALQVPFTEEAVEPTLWKRWILGNRSKLILPSSYGLPSPCAARLKRSGGLYSSHQYCSITFLRKSSLLATTSAPRGSLCQTLLFALNTELKFSLLMQNTANISEGHSSQGRKPKEWLKF